MDGERLMGANTLLFNSFSSDFEWNVSVSHSFLIGYRDANQHTLKVLQFARAFKLLLRVEWIVGLSSIGSTLLCCGTLKTLGTSSDALNSALSESWCLESCPLAGTKVGMPPPVQPGSALLI